MSDKGRAYVEQRSPYKGIFYSIHYRLGSLENDTNGHRLWIGDAKLAYVCRCSVKTVQRAKIQMVKDGFLEKLFPATGQFTAEYRFLFPATTTNIDLDTLGNDVEVGGHSVRVGGQRRPSSRTSGPSSPTYTNEGNKESEAASDSDVSEPVDLAAVRRRNDEILGRRRAQ